MRFEQLQEYQQKIIGNGCQGKGGKVRPPRADVFMAACNNHDLAYYIGCTKKDRLKADIQLRRDMRVRIKLMPVSQIRAVMSPIFKKLPSSLIKILFYRWADLYAVGVMCFGWKFFYYGDKPQGLP